LDAVEPGAGAAAMATGILSVALHLAGYETFSELWLAIGGAIWVMLVAVVGARLIAHRARWLKEADTPAALTGVAATAVLGSRCAFLGWDVVAIAALVIAAVAWVVLVPAVLVHWAPPTVGAHFMLCVATEAVAVLGAMVAVMLDEGWIAVLSTVAFIVGLAFYGLVLRRFAFTELEVGAGDHWVWTGALTISALAAGELVRASAALGWGPPLRDVLRIATLAILALAWVGYVVLVICEVRWPRLGFDVRRWATAFPLGMTAAATMTAASSTALDGLWPIGVALTWPAVVVCAVLLLVSARHAVRSAAMPCDA